jgi:uncharacterized protein (TIGR03435 family)
MGSAMTKERPSRSFFGKRLLLSAAALGTFAGGAVLAEHGLPLTAAAVQAQFEAASIRPSNKTSSTPRRACRGSDTVPDPQRAQVQVPLGRCTFESARLDDLIVVAYSDDLSWIRNQPPRSDVLGGPDWVHSDLFDVEAIVENPPAVTARDLHQMMQALIADRFKLKLHRESGETAGYVLGRANRGPKLSPAKDKTITGRNRIQRVATSPGVITISGRNVSMTTLSDLLTTFGMGPVVDKTNIDGTFDFFLTYAAESVSALGRKDEPSPALQDTGAASIFTALREQLGLQLVSQKVSMEYLVIDSAERPSMN